MQLLYRITLLALISLCCSGQTGSPLVIYTGSPLRCEGRPVTFRILNDSGLTDFTWVITPARGVTINGDGNTSALVATFNSTGTFTVSVSANDTATRSGQLTFGISRSASASFNASLTTQGYPAELVLTDYSGNSKAIRWQFSDGGTDSLAHLKKSYLTSGSYSVGLIAYGQNGCNDTASYNFRIADSSGITLPNVFTPNGDGVNDIYRPIARGIGKMLARVYNRDQVLIHSWDRVNGSWDGRTTSGEPCPPGVYIVVVEATGFDGRSYSLGVSVTLLR